MKFKLVEDSQVLDKNAEEVIDDMPKEAQQEIDKAQKILDVRTPIENPSLVTNALDRSLKIALKAHKHGRMAGKAANLLFVGRAGTGKTSQIKQWADARGVNLVQKDAKTFDKSDIGGGVAAKVDDNGKRTNKMTHLSNEEFDMLGLPNSVLFLDELNRADPEVMGSLLTLILDHQIPDNESESGMKTFDNFLFTVAAINPTSADYEGTNTLDAAMLDRFTKYDMGEVDTPQYKRYLVKKFTEQIKECEEDVKEAQEDGDDWDLQEAVDDLTAAQGRVKLINTLLSSPLFQWDSVEDAEEANLDQEHTLSPRGFSAVIARCDGTKEGLLDVWDAEVNPNKKDMVEQILSDYTDVDNKANDALRYKDGIAPKEEDDDSEGSIFDNTPKTSEWDKFSDLF